MITTFVLILVRGYIAMLVLCTGPGPMFRANSVKSNPIAKGVVLIIYLASDEISKS